MEAIKIYLGCGNLVNRDDAIDIRVSKYSEIQNIITFFNNYPIVDNKNKDFQDFVNVANLMLNSSHLTEEGFKIICEIKTGMNQGHID